MVGIPTARANIDTGQVLLHWLDPVWPFFFADRPGLAMLARILYHWPKRSDCFATPTSRAFIFLLT